ncbi:MAG: ribonuclease HII [Desulfarculus sp.]|nr:MAG: ribonuclease HII [Desulfarculus sp.]
MPAAPAGPTLHKEAGLFRRGFRRVAGVDEAGRGPLAGPVVAAAVILPLDWGRQGVDDSKRLSADRRAELAEVIKAEAVAWALGRAEPPEIDRLNIHRASLLAMQRAVQGLEPAADYLLIDGRFGLNLGLPQEAVVKGDATCLSVAAASILAKVERDGLMQVLHRQYPAYNFAANKGYPTLEHRLALERHGPCAVHRRSYGPVAQMALSLDGGWAGEQAPALGREAETLARALLERAGMQVVEANRCTAAGELDLVAWDGATLVFVEVKARSGREHGLPEEAVDQRKQRRLAQAAAAYLAEMGPPVPACRFDVVALEFGSGPPRMRHLKDAFRPE